MVKKIVAAFLALALIFSPAGNFVFHQQPTVSAKGYRSGVKSFNPSRGNTTLFKNKQQRQNINRNGTSAGTSTSSWGRGFMGGLFFGGLSGLLFGSFLAHMGGFGMMAGLLINVLAIVAILALGRYLLSGWFRRKKTKEYDPWKR